MNAKVSLGICVKSHYHSVLYNAMSIKISCASMYIHMKAMTTKDIRVEHDKKFIPPGTGPDCWLAFLSAI